MNMTPEQLKAIYKKLPEDLREVYFSMDTADVVQNIGKKYNLLIDVTGELAYEVGGVMLGITPIKNFVPNLAQRLEVGMDVAQKIADDVNEQIFAKVRESLKKLHEGGIDAVAPAAAQATQAASVKIPQQGVWQTATPVSPVAGQVAPSVPNIQPVKAPSVVQATQYNAGQAREELLKEIESGEKLPEIFGGVNKPQNGADLTQKKGEAPPNLPVNPFEAKMGGVFKAPMTEGEVKAAEKPEGGYKGTDPYREPIE